MRRVLSAAICAVLLTLALGAPAAQGAASDPLFVFTPVPPPGGGQTPPPIGYFYGPCGLTVDSAGDFYVADYYHHAVDLYNGTANYTSETVSGSTGYLTQVANEDPLDGPCGLAVDSTGRLYVNNFHRNVAEFTLSPFPYRKSPSPASTFSVGPLLAGIGAANDPSAHSTGVAVDSSDNVYVDERTYVQEYDSSGNPVAQIGLDPSADYYGLAVSQYPGTLGYVYVPDATANTVKVFDPATSITTPVSEIGVGNPFNSLRDAAVAVNRVSGEVYIADNTQPLYTERPQATIYVYSSANAYKGHLKYNVTDALPLGLAVDNSAQASQGRVYVTSGNTEPASIYAYGPGSATTAAPLAPLGNVTGSGSGSAASGGGGSASPPQNDGSLPTQDSAPAQSASPVSQATPTSVTMAPAPAVHHRAHRRRKHRHHKKKRRSARRRHHHGKNQRGRR